MKPVRRWTFGVSAVHRRIAGALALALVGTAAVLAAAEPVIQYRFQGRMQSIDE